MFFVSNWIEMEKKALEATAWNLGWVRKVKANMFFQVLAIPLFLVWNGFMGKTRDGWVKFYRDWVSFGSEMVFETLGLQWVLSHLIFSVFFSKINLKYFSSKRVKFKGSCQTYLLFIGIMVIKWLHKKFRLYFWYKISVDLKLTIKI